MYRRARADIAARHSLPSRLALINSPGINLPPAGRCLVFSFRSPARSRASLVITYIHAARNVNTRGSRPVRFDFWLVSERSRNFSRPLSGLLFLPDFFPASAELWNSVACDKKGYFFKLAFLGQLLRVSGHGEITKMSLYFFNFSAESDNFYGVKLFYKKCASKAQSLAHLFPMRVDTHSEIKRAEHIIEQNPLSRR